MQQKSTIEKVGVLPTRFQGVLDATRVRGFQGVIGNSFSAWLGQRWGLSDGSAPTPAAKSFRQWRDPSVFAAWPRPVTQTQANYAFFPTLSLAVVLRPMAALLPAATLTPATERHSGAPLPINHQLSNHYAVSSSLTLALSLRSMVSQFSATALRSVLERQPANRNELTRQSQSEGLFLPLVKEAREGAHGPERSRAQTWLAFLPFLSSESRERLYGLERNSEQSREQIWMAFLSRTAAPTTNIQLANLGENLSASAFASPAVMLKLPELQLLRFQEKLLTTTAREIQTNAGGVFSTSSGGIGREVPKWPSSSSLPHTGATLVQQQGSKGTTTSSFPDSGATPVSRAVRASNRAQNEAALSRQALTRSIGVSPVLNWQTDRGRMTQTGTLNVTHIWPAPLPTRVGTNPQWMSYQVNAEGSVSPRLVLVGNHSMSLASQLPKNGRKAVRLAMAGVPTAFSAAEEPDLAPRLAYTKSPKSGEGANQVAASFAQMALHYQQREAPSASNLSETLNDLRQSLSDFKKVSRSVPAPPEIDQLTRQVYDQLKNELRIERERRGL